MTRRYRNVPVGAVCGFCAGAAILGLVTHGTIEDWVMPGGRQWLAILGLGLGPVGAAFFVWDHGTKHGDIQILGVLAYGAPLLSTCLLIAFGKAIATPAIVAGCVLIVGGAVLASANFNSRNAGNEILFNNANRCVWQLGHNYVNIGQKESDCAVQQCLTDL